MTAQQKARFLGLVKNAAASLTEEIIDMLDQNPHVLIPSVHLRKQMYRKRKEQEGNSQGVCAGKRVVSRSRKTRRDR